MVNYYRCESELNHFHHKIDRKININLKIYKGKLCFSENYLRFVLYLSIWYYSIELFLERNLKKWLLRIQIIIIGKYI